MKLEVGCGVDKSYKFSPKVSGEDVIYIDLEKPAKKIGNFIRCDAQWLPFISLTFTDVYASHLIEHLQNPLKFLLDVKKLLVVGGKLWLWTPNFTSPSARKDRSHRYTFNYFSLKALLKTAGYKPVMFLPFIPYRFLRPLLFFLQMNYMLAAKKRKHKDRHSLSLAYKMDMKDKVKCIQERSPFSIRST